MPLNYKPVEILIFAEQLHSDSDFDGTHQKGSFLSFVPSIGSQEVATIFRDAGFTAKVIDFFSLFTLAEMKKIVDMYTDENTKMIGFSSTFFNRTNKLLDEYIYEDKIRFTEESIRKTATLTYFEKFNSMPIGNDPAIEFFSYIKSTKPNIKIVMGGARTQYFAHHAYVDKVFTGFATSEIVDYIREPYKFINTNQYFTSNAIYDEEFKNRQIRVDATDPANKVLFENSGFALEVARGCIFNCDFCEFSEKNKAGSIERYARSIESIRSFLQYNYDNFGTKYYAFSDDTFNSSVDKLIMVRDAVKLLTFSPKFSAFIRLELLVRFPQQLELLSEIGLISMHLGIESTNPVALKNIHKSMTPEKIRDQWGPLYETIRGKMTVRATYIFGLPGDTPATLDESHQWIAEESHKYFSDALAYGYFLHRGAVDERLKSPINRNAEQFGYVFTEGDSVDGPWVNTLYGTTHADCSRRAYNLNALTRQRPSTRICGMRTSSIIAASPHFSLEDVLSTHPSQLNPATDVHNKVNRYKRIILDDEYYTDI